MCSACTLSLNECSYQLHNDCILVLTTGGQEVQWMAAPQETPPGCPPGLEYLTQVDQILINQQVELLEGMQVYLMYAYVCALMILT